MVTLLTADRTFERVAARVENESLFLPASELAAATGFERTPEGLCRGGVCVPVPPGSPLVRGDAEQSVDVAALWRLLDRPVLRDESGDVWVLGEGHGERAADLESLVAPDFELPDLAGATHRLADHRGHKVLLVTWASW